MQKNKKNFNKKVKNSSTTKTAKTKTKKNLSWQSISKNTKSKVFSEKIKSQLFLLQWYYNYLYLGKFLENIIMNNDFSKYAQDLKIPTWDNTSFMLNGNNLKDKLKLISQNPGKKNIFWYFVELSSFRGVMSVMNELLETEWNFVPFLNDLLWKQFFDFVHIVKFARNVLIHATGSQLFIGINSFDKHRTFLTSKNKTILNINFNYSKKISWRTWSKDYSVDIKIDFAKMYSWRSFWKVISVHQLYLLCELCYNITLVYIKNR